MCVTDPAYLSLDVDWSQCAEAARRGVDVQVAGEVLSAGGRRSLEHGVRVERVVDAEVQVRHAAVTGRRQHLGQHGDHAVLVLRQPRVPVDQQNRDE